MKKTVLMLLWSLFLVMTLMAAPKMSDLEIRNLHGPVESMGSETTTYYFDEQGKITSETYDYDDGYFGDIYYEYDAKSRLVTIEDIDGFYGDVLSGTYYTYGDDDKLQEVRTEHSSYVEYTRYTYDKNGYLTWTKVYDPDENLISAMETVPDKKGNTIRKNYFDQDMNLLRYELLEYNKSGYETLVQNYGPDNNLTGKVAYKYNNRNQVTEELHTGEEILVDKILRSYDDKGNLTKVSSHYPQSDQTIVCTMEYVFDDHGNWTEQRQIIDGAETSATFRTITYYTLDE